jgi:hypothetical protein
MTEGHGAFADALEDQVVESAALGEVDGGTEAVGRKAGTTSKSDRFGHIGLLKRLLLSRQAPKPDRPTRHQAASP